MPNYRRPLLHRFLEQVAITSDCWHWMGTINKHGYGTIWTWKECSRLAHRVAYHLFIGNIPAGMVIDHLCRNRACVNPDHLEVVTNAVNIQRGFVGILNNAEARKTHCPKGHPYDAENTGPAARNPKWRRCRACNRERERARVAS